MPMNRGFQMGACDAPKRRVRRWQIPRAEMTNAASGVFNPSQQQEKCNKKGSPSLSCLLVYGCHFTW